MNVYDKAYELVKALYEVLNLNPLIHRMFDAERRLMVIMEDINRIIAEPFEEIRG